MTTDSNMTHLVSLTNIRLLDEVDRIAEAMSVQAERNKRWWLCGFSIIYLTGTCVIASQKLLWNDELFTLYISRLPSLASIWSALATGADQSPPLFFIITRASLFLFGANQLAIRLPEVLGFWIMSLCLFQFVSKRSSALHGFTAMLFPLVTTAYEYAYEARPYGLVLGFCGLSLLFWQSAAEGQYRKVSLVGLAISSAAAVASHYYAVLLLFAIGSGEMVRSLSRRNLDIHIWTALAFAMTPLLLVLPIIEAARSYAAHFWARPYWALMPECYYFLLRPALLPLVATLILAAFYSTTQPFLTRSSQRSYPTPALYEIAAAVGFIAIPIVGIVLAKLATGTFTYRYALPAVIGFSIIVAFATYRLLDRRAIIGAALIVSFCGGFMMIAVRNVQRTIAVSQDQTKTYDFIRFQSGNGLPIVASDAHTFMRLTYYSPEDIASRLVYLADPQFSLRHLGYTTVDRQMLDLKPWFRLKIEEYGPYIASHQQFLVYGHIGWLNWVVSELAAANNRHIELRGRDGNNLLFLVSSKD